VSEKPDAAWLPALVLDTTAMSAGRPVLQSPFTVARTDMFDLLSPALATQSLTLAQAVHNSARFPYVSPAGLVRSVSTERRRHVVDGGYFDTTGVDTLLDVTQALQAIDHEITFIPIYVTNGPIDRHVNDHALDPAQKTTPSAAPTPGGAASTPDLALPDDTQGGAPIEILGELFAPVRALLQTRGAHGEVAIDRQQRTVGTVTFGFCRLAACADGTWKELPPDAPDTSADSCVEMRSQPPLGWQLSSEMTRRLDAYWTTCSANKTGAAAVSALLERDR